MRNASAISDKHTCIKKTLYLLFFLPSYDFCLCSVTYRFSPCLSAILKGECLVPLMEKGFDRGKKIVSRYFL